jgi:hypothetical protein
MKREDMQKKTSLVTSNAISSLHIQRESRVAAGSVRFEELLGIW